MTSKIDVSILSITLLSFKPNESNLKEIRCAAYTLQWLFGSPGLPCQPRRQPWLTRSFPRSVPWRSRV